MKTNNNERDKETDRQNCDGIYVLAYNECNKLVTNDYRPESMQSSYMQLLTSGI